MRNWTTEQRQRQRELIQRWKPWKQSTGAKTPEGKKRSSQNAYKIEKNFKILAFLNNLNTMLKKQKRFIQIKKGH